LRQNNVFLQFLFIFGYALCRDWLQHCGLAMQSPELHYRVQDCEGQDMASSLRPSLPLFSSDLVPNAKASLSTKEEMKASCTDFVLHVGGSVWALDWCPQRPQWSNFNVKTEVPYFISITKIVLQWLSHVLLNNIALVPY
jgi:hypothetical protein